MPSCSKQSGGIGAADHALEVYNGPGHQIAKLDNDNTIAMTPNNNVQSGGKKRGKKGGKKNVLVPLVLTAANHLLYPALASKKQGSKKYSSKRQGGKKNILVPLALMTANQIAFNKFGKSNNRYKNKSLKRGSMKRGGNMVNKLVVPTALTTLSYFYGKNRKTSKNMA